MRKFVAIALGSFLFLSTSPAIAVTPKAGVSCSKFGSKATYKGREFTCIKKGTKRVWNSGVLIKTTPKPTSKPTPSQSSTATPAPSTPSATPSASPSSTIKGFTKEEVAQHNSSSSCWTIINGDVFDLTQWISRHPGGAAAIRGLCGIDGSRAFGNQHEGQRDPARELAKYFIGRLTT